MDSSIFIRRGREKIFIKKKISKFPYKKKRNDWFISREPVTGVDIKLQSLTIHVSVAVGRLDIRGVLIYIRSHTNRRKCKRSVGNYERAAALIRSGSRARALACSLARTLARSNRPGINTSRVACDGNVSDKKKGVYIYIYIARAFISEHINAKKLPCPTGRAIAYRRVRT